MRLIKELLDPFRQGESDWCCERCRLAAAHAAAERSRRLAAREAYVPDRIGTQPPLVRQVSLQ